MHECSGCHRGMGDTWCRSARFQSGLTWVLHTHTRSVRMGGGKGKRERKERRERKEEKEKKRERGKEEKEKKR